MADVVESVLAAAAEKESKYRSIEVEKAIDLEIDEGNLLAVDSNPLDIDLLRKSKEKYLKDLARDNTQLLLNNIWDLPVEAVDDIIVAKLPEPKTVLPREKPAPKGKLLTKWEEYAKLKGIKKVKKDRMIWDDATKEWRPRYGYKRANDDTKDWLIEVPATADPYEDQFAKRKKAKDERTAKNELQRLRNIARGMKGNNKIPGVGLTPTNNPDSDHVATSLSVAKKATASIGKFQKGLKDEKPPKNTGKKRKFDPNIADFGLENKRNMDLLGEMSRFKPVLNVTKAVNDNVKETRKKEYEESNAKKTGKRGKGKQPGREKKKKGNAKGGKGKKRR